MVGFSCQLIFNIDKQMVKVVVFGNDKIYKVGQELNLHWDIEDIVVFGRDKNERKKRIQKRKRKAF